MIESNVGMVFLKMDSDLKLKKQVNSDQLNALLEFLQDHQQLAKGLTRGRRAKFNTLKLWNLCAKKLNAIRDGSFKDGKGWSKYWCDMKYRVRRRALEQKAAKESNSPPTESNTYWSPTEKVVLSLIGEASVKNVVIKTDPLLHEEHLEVHDHAEITEENDCASDIEQPRLTRSSKKRHFSADLNNIDDSEGVGSQYEKKPRISSFENNNTDCDDAKEFIRLEREKLEKIERVNESLQTIAGEITRLSDVMAHIRDVLINHRVNS